MRRALVTGITGQDGSYLAEQLCSEGVEVHGLIRPGSSPVVPLPTSVVRHSGDITSSADIDRVLQTVTPDAVFNLAALSSVASCWRDPDACVAVNAVAAGALMTATLRLQERTGSPVSFVQASSSEIYGPSGTGRQDESTSLAPANPYGAAKAYAHMIGKVFRTRGLPISCLVLYNHESPRRPRQFVTRKITMGVAAIAEGTAISLELGDINLSRDWGWAPDYVDAMVRTARCQPNTDLVIASGESHTIRDVLDAAFTRVGITDWERYVQTDPSLHRPSDATRMVGDPSTAERILGWRRSMDFVEIVHAMVDADVQPDPPAC